MARPVSVQLAPLCGATSGAFEVAGPPEQEIDLRRA